VARSGWAFSAPAWHIARLGRPSRPLRRQPRAPHEAERRAPPSKTRTISHCTHRPRSARALCRTARVFFLSTSERLHGVLQIYRERPKSGPHRTPIFQPVQRVHCRGGACTTPGAACTALPSASTAVSTACMHLPSRALRFAPRTGRRKLVPHPSAYARHSSPPGRASIAVRDRGSAITSMGGHRLFLNSHSACKPSERYDDTKSVVPS
jgi:hypothetical protein